MAIPGFPGGLIIHQGHLKEGFANGLERQVIASQEGAGLTMIKSLTHLPSVFVLLREGSQRTRYGMGQSPALVPVVISVQAFQPVPGVHVIYRCHPLFHSGALLDNKHASGWLDAAHFVAMYQASTGDPRQESAARREDSLSHTLSTQSAARGEDVLECPMSNLKARLAEGLVGFQTFQGGGDPRAFRVLCLFCARWG